MATEAQVTANRSNAEKSTGPRTPEGKEKASQNALKHGLFAREAVIRGEDEDEFELHRESLLDQLMPRAPLEEILADRIVDLSWRLKRAAQDQSDAFAALYEKYSAQQVAAGPEAGSAGGTGIPSASLSGQARPVNSNPGQARPEPCERDAHATAGMIGRMILEDFTHEAVLDRLLRYERRIESSLYRTLNELRRVHDQLQKAAQEEASIVQRWREEDWEAKKARAFARCPTANVSPGPAGPGEVGRGRPTYEEVPHPGAIASWQDAGPAPDEPPENEMCKTNPISADAAVESPHFSNIPSFQHSSPQVWDTEQSCKTNPISEGVSVVKCQGASQSCKTNPICGSPHGMGIPSASLSGQACQTKPISGGPDRG